MLSALRLRKESVAVLATLLFGACHHAPRNNPFDPALTPPVELTVALDDTAGTATLTWTRYEGQQPFQEYRVLRNIVDRRSVDTLAHIPAIEQTAFVDTTLEPNTAYVYRVEVVNGGGYAASSEEKGVAGFSVGAVRLAEVERDPRAGTLTLRWNRYVGPDFAGYQLHRRQVGTDREEMLIEIAAPTDTAFADSTAQAGVEYVYWVVVQAAGQTLLGNTQEGQLVLSPVEITQADFNSAKASASLQWTRYAGPRFRAYRVERRSAGVTPQVLKEIADLADTSLVDQSLLGNTEYFYRVVVETERGEEVHGEEQSGSFHRLVATWPFSPANRSLVRLYAEGDQLVALRLSASRGSSVMVRRLYLLDLAGQVLDSRVLVSNLTSLHLTQRSSATALSQAGQRFLSTSAKGSSDFDSYGSIGLLVFGLDQKPVMRELRLFESAFPEPLSGPEGRVLGEIALKGRNGHLDKVRVSTKGLLLFAEDFEDFPRGGLQGTLQGWDFSGSNSIAAEMLYSGAEGVARYADATWQDFRLEAETAFTETSYEAEAGIQLGGDTFSSFALTLSNYPQRIALDWTFAPPAELGLEAKHQRFTMPLPILSDQPYRLGLEMVDGQLSASVRAPLLWVGANPSQPQWTSLATLGDYLAFTVYDQPYLLSPEGGVSSLSPFEAGVGEMRGWEGRRGSQLGVCLPGANKLLIGSVPAGQEADWPTFLANTLGPAVGPPADFLFYPLSFDVGPDGRIYVLDAGNARIVVFDSSRRYITQWGRWGKGEGEFDFGRGAFTSPGELDFAGSIAVDDQGYIYVSDEINGRIQKFAP